MQSPIRLSHNLLSFHVPLLSLLLCCPVGAPGASGSAHLLVFHSEGCKDCEYVQDDLIPRIEAEFGSAVQFRFLDVDSADNFQLLIALEGRYGDRENEFPVVVGGDRILGGKDEVDGGLHQLIQECLAKGGCPWPSAEFHAAEVEGPSEGEFPPVYVAYLYRIRCKQCDRASRTLAELTSKHEQIEIRKLDIAQSANQQLAEAMGSLYGVPERRRLVAPSVFVGPHYLIGDEVSYGAIDSLIGLVASTGTECPWEKAEAYVEEARKGIVERFKALGVFTLLGAGLLDGVNPCAFATIVFFISYLTFMGRRGREVLAIGAAFTLAVFITYYAIGAGALRFLQHFQYLRILSRILYVLMAALTFTLAVLSFRDWVLYRRGRTKDMALQLPMALKQRIHASIRKDTKSRYVVVGAFVTGAVVSVLELACTGQVYLPTIVFVTGVPTLRVHALAYLFLYNVMFVLPLVAIFSVAYMGVSSQTLGNVLQKRLGSLKILLGFLFLGLAGFLVYAAF
jgi:cytochrome c biogenesis protein CcdA